MALITFFNFGDCFLCPEEESPGKPSQKRLTIWRGFQGWMMLLKSAQGPVGELNSWVNWAFAFEVDLSTTVHTARWFSRVLPRL